MKRTGRQSQRLILMMKGRCGCGRIVREFIKNLPA